MSIERRTLKTRRKRSRRFEERRDISFPFKSEEWVNALENRKEYVLWPVMNRRETNRRNGERRTLERRLLYKES